MTDAVWHVEITDLAQSDFDQALIWTQKRFGPTQEAIYRQLLTAGLASLARGPNTPTVRQRNVDGDKLFVLRPRLGRRRATHLLFFEVHPDENRVVVLRILHDKMDLPRHLAARG